jgi:hypothetical protein
MQAKHVDGGRASGRGRAAHAKAQRRKGAEDSDEGQERGWELFWNGRDASVSRVEGDEACV